MPKCTRTQAPHSFPPNRTTSSLWLSVQDLQDLSLESSVAGSARLILLLADLSLVQRVLETKLSLCRSSPDRPHLPHIQPGGKITRTNYVTQEARHPIDIVYYSEAYKYVYVPTLSSASPSSRPISACPQSVPVVNTAFFNPKHRLLCSASITCSLRPQHRSGLCSVCLNRFLANCTFNSTHPLVQFSSLVDNRYFYRSSYLPSHNHTNVYKYTHPSVPNRSVP